ncbi:MAG: hypothetical protein HHAS10_07160 [Candidatus Altimarinota bacterium]
MKAWKQSFQEYVGGKDDPNAHEQILFERAQKYIRRLTWIPGIEMIALVNSLSMLATHPDSDIDLFVITGKNRLWLVRILMTIILTLLGVRRSGKDIPGNFCLSFFLTTEAMNLEKIAIQNDIYLYYWIYYLRPMYSKNYTYDRFLASNPWVQLDIPQYQKNISDLKQVLGNQKENRVLDSLNALCCFIFEARTRKTNAKLGNPWGVIISDGMLKFHPEDRRKEISEHFFGEK